MLHYFSVGTVSELICLIIALICLTKDSSLIWRIMILYMLITCLAEFAGVYVERQGHFNYWIYNSFLFFEAGFNLLIFGYLYTQYNKSKYSLVGVSLFVILYTYQLNRHGINAYDNLTYTIMSATYVLYGLYYYHLLILDDNHVNLKYLPAFWWVAGTIFFYFGNTACNLFSIRFGGLKTYQHLSYVVFKVLNVILYGCWSYSFICKKWLTTKFKVSS
jgi:hypothetical protein